MSPKRTPDAQPIRKVTKVGTGGDTPENSAEGRINNLVFPQQYAERLKRESTENIARLRTARQRTMESIDRDLNALNRNDHGLDSETVDQFVALLKTARNELARSEQLSTEQAAHLKVTGERLEALVEKVRRCMKNHPDD